MKNYEIEIALEYINKQDSVFRTSRFTPTTRYEVKQFIKTLKSKYDTYIECRNDILQEFVSDGKATESDGTINFKEEFIPEINSKITELLSIDVDITLLSDECSKEILSKDLTIDEDEIINLISNKGV